MERAYRTPGLHEITVAQEKLQYSNIFAIANFTICRQKFPKNCPLIYFSVPLSPNKFSFLFLPLCSARLEIPKKIPPFQPQMNRCPPCSSTRAALCRRHRKYRLVRQDSLHPTMWINQYIVSYYRPTNMTTAMCCKR